MWLLFLFAGIVFWTFTEYMLHRFLGHTHKGKNFFKAEHSTHHSKANYFAPAYKKIIAAVIVAAALTFITNLLTTLPNAIAFVSGLMSMYGLYEITHYRYHAFKPIIAPFIILRKHHFYHHFHNPSVNHGVTSRFWDRVFGTFQEVEQVRVPKSMSMNWLLENGDISPAYSEHFKLNKR
jgi:sterol desaturase/sphingolipid hydroxylase (fatty acid hydroxylase superfamily)